MSMIIPQDGFFDMVEHPSIRDDAEAHYDSHAFVGAQKESGKNQAIDERKRVDGIDDEDDEESKAEYPMTGRGTNNGLD